MTTAARYARAASLNLRTASRACSCALARETARRLFRKHLRDSRTLKASRRGGMAATDDYEGSARCAKGCELGKGVLGGRKDTAVTDRGERS